MPKRRLTELSVHKLPPAAVTYLVWDTHQRGLAIRIQPTGRKAWYVVYSRRGRPRWLHLGDADVIGLADARQMAAEAMLAVAKGKDPAAEKRAQRGSGSFEQLAQRYVETYAKKNNKSWQQPDRLVRRYLLPRWGKLQAAAIVRADVKTLMGSIAAPVLANQILAAASAVFSWATAEELLPANPCRGVARNKTRSRERILADSEVPKVWAAFGDAGLVVSSALKCVLLLGQRPGEITHMRAEHIVDGWWTMPGEPVPALGWPGTKNSQNHRIWLPAPAQVLLAELDDEAAEGFVFAGPRGRPVDGLRALVHPNRRDDEPCGGLPPPSDRPPSLRRPPKVRTPPPAHLRST